MNLDRILSEIDLEISRLQQAKHLLSENSEGPNGAKRGPGRPPAFSTLSKAAKSVAPKRRTMSAAGRARIAAAQKARWAKAKKATRKSATTALSKKAVAKQPASAKAAAKKTAAAKTESSTTAS